MKRIAAFLLSITILLSLFPVEAYAADTAAEEKNLIIAPDPGLPDNNELFAAYTDQVFFGTSIATFGFSAGSRLSGDLKVLYDSLVPFIRQIAEGKRSSTTISIGQTVRYDKTTYKPDVEASFTGKSLTSSDLTRLLTALMSDLPYEMYWYDKTSGCSTQLLASKKLLYVKLKFAVSTNYRSSKYKTDAKKISAVGLAAANAKSIVSCYASASDYNKLMGYSYAICNLTDYNFSAASKGNYSKNNDPWQMIHVFDGDSSTKVVCEGYAKAFQYLCDLSKFRGDVNCHTVTGTVSGEDHMWNIVTLDGKHYLTDVTNTDSQRYGNALLLAGCTGSIDKGYTVSRLTYRYNSATRNLWGTGSSSILRLAKAAYSPDVYLNHTHSYSNWDKVTGATSSQIGINNRICSKCGYMDTKCTDTAGLEPPTLSLTCNSSTGKPQLKWDKVSGADSYHVYRATSKNGSFSRIKSTSSTSYTDSSAKAGKVYYYKVIALVKSSGKTSDSSSIVSRMCDLPRPSVTISVNTTTGKPVVKWKTVSGAAKYYIYRSESENGTYTRVKTAISARSYEDTKAKAGITYYYKVKAIHKRESACSDYSTAVTRTCDLAKPSISIGLTKSGDPRITWNAVNGAQGYCIYRATSKNGTYKKVSSTTSSRKFVDTNAKAKKQYYYKVQAIHRNTGANSAFSSAKSIVAK